MPLTDDKEKLDSILELFYDRFDKYNTKVLVTLGEAIKQFDDLTNFKPYSNSTSRY